MPVYYKKSEFKQTVIITFAADALKSDIPMGGGHQGLFKAAIVPWAGLATTKRVNQKAKRAKGRHEIHETNRASVEASDSRAPKFRVNWA